MLSPCIFLKEACYPEPDQFVNNQKYGPHLPPMTLEQAKASQPQNQVDQQTRIQKLEDEVAQLKGHPHNNA